MMKRTYKFSMVLAGAGLMWLTGCGGSSQSTTTNNPPPTVAIAPKGGSSQSAKVGSAFGAPLVATVTSNGNPASGVSVTFTAPASGASGTFAGGKSTETDTTDAQGVATSSAFTANTTIGSYTVTASTSGASQSASFSLSNTVGTAAKITATAGSSQSTIVGNPFTTPLSATVVDVGNNPVSGVLVTFSAPASGASGTFAGGKSTETDTTNTQGVATSSAFTANTTVGSYAITAAASGVSQAASFSLSNTVGAAAKITATTGASQSAIVGNAFATALSATVVDIGNNPVSGVVVTFTAPASGASGVFADSTTNTTTATTDASGVATAATFTANSTVGGPYMVTATASGITTSASFSLTNSPVPLKLYAFYLSGLEASNTNFGTAYYALAGSVQIDQNGNVIAGEQDYNDAAGFTSPQPQGDQITGGTLTVNTTTGQGTLTLQTNNTSLGVAGVETVAVQFVNSSHAMVTQFDGSATSSGSMDVQNLSSVPTGGYSFVMSGVDSTYSATAAGGVFTVNGTALTNGVVDVNASSGATTGTTWAGTMSAPDAFGRGTITGTGMTLNYYEVGPEVMRLIDVDTTDSAIGLAYGQGSATFTNASLGTSLLTMQGNPQGFLFATLGEYTTTPGTGTLQGVEDDDEQGSVNSAFLVTGTYSLSNAVNSVTYNGYGNATFATGGSSNVTSVGIYMIDPTLNLNDPNNPTGGGGALLLDLDSALVGGTGVMIPQTDTSTSSFSGNYAVGAQAYYGGGAGWEFDFVSQGSVSSLSLNAIGMFSDPWNYILPTNPTDSGTTFSGTLTPDGTNAGRYTMTLSVTPSGGSPTTFNTAAYQASGAQLYWLDEDNSDLWLGQIAQQGSLNGVPAVTRPIGIRKKK